MSGRWGQPGERPALLEGGWLLTPSLAVLLAALCILVGMAVDVLA